VIRAGLIGAGSAALVVLLARTLAYAAEPGPAARVLEQRAGGPTLPALALVSLALGFAIAVCVCWLAALAVRERALIERRSAERFAARRALAVAAALSVTTCVTGGLLEAYLHWRAGLGWHGLHCLAGPVHRDLIPIETGLSFVAAALLAAGRHVVMWMRRTFARLAVLVSRAWCLAPAVLGRFDVPRPALCVGSASARAPPLLGRP
jgi:hypothetical protein